MRLIFAGTPEFAARALSALLAAGHDLRVVLTQPDRPSGRGMKLAPSAVKALALERGLTVRQPASLKSEQIREVLQSAGADAMVVAAYGLILPESVLKTTRLGAINIHASLLPRWRGAAPIQRAILAGDTHSGISIMQMDAGLDMGPVLAARSIAISADDTTGSLHDKLAGLGALMIVDTLAMLERGSVTATAQTDSGATYAAKINQLEAGIDWNESAAAIERKVRAFNPQPGAFALIKGVAVKIWRARALERGGVPGAILQAGPEGIVVGCGSQALCLQELQRAGGRRLSAAQFLSGFTLAAGEQLESSARTPI